MNGGHRQLFAQQDQHLEDVSQTVSTLKQVATVMGNELDDQTRLINDLEMDVDNTQTKLTGGLGRMHQFIKDNADTKQQWTICILIACLILLLVFVFYL